MLQLTYFCHQKCICQQFWSKCFSALVLQLSPVIAGGIVSAGSAEIPEIPRLANPIYDHISFHTVTF